MHASSIVNYHYYGHHPHQTTNIGGANCQIGAAAADEQLRTLVTPNQATDLDSDENDSENATRSHFQAAPIVTNHPDQDVQSSGSMLGQLMPDDGQKVHFVENRLACGQIAYESYENSQEHYRYQATATAYQEEEEEAHYYEQQQQYQSQAPGKQQEHIGAEVPADQTAFHHQPTQEPHLVLESNRHQAVNLSSEQSAHGPFQASNQSPVYYDLTSASIPQPKTSSSSSAVTLHYHAHHLHQNPINHQHEQDAPLELQRSANFFYHQPADPYNETGGGGNEPQRYLAEFVPVSTEQNRFSRTLDWHEGLQEAAGPEQQAIDCQQMASYPYETSGGGIALGPAYPQTHLNAIPNTSGDFQPTTNENYHHTYQPITGHIQEHQNGCQGKQINLSMCKHQPSYETPHHLMEQATCSSGPQRDSPSRAMSTLSESLSMTTNSDMESIDSALTRDEKKAREANIPLSYHEIVNLSIDQFNEQLLRYPYTEAQLTLMKDIRRRGKNKVAAQTCRKRKMEQITELQQEVAELANKRVLLALERSRLSQEHAKLVEEYNRWCRASGTEFV